MAKAKEIHDINGMLDVIEEKANDSTSEVTFEDVLEAIGERAFGPLLLLLGLIVVAPLVGDIPGVPTIIGLMVLLICGQLLIGRRQFWFPGWIRTRSITATRIQKIVKKTRTPARWVDRLLRPRLQWLVSGPGLQVIAGLSGAVALAMPLMEVVPFSANLAGAILTAFGLALIGRDGVFAIVAHLLVLVTVGILIVGLR